MSLRHLAMAAAIAAPLAAAPQAAHAWGIDYSDTYLSVRYVPEQKSPGYEKDVPMVAGNISYANGWTYGSNFVSLDFENFSKHGNPSNAINPANRDSDSFEFYGVFRTVASGNKIIGGDTFRFGPIRDIGLEFGLDLDTHNDTFASYKKLLVFGPQFSINVPRGFWNITLGVSKEWNTNAFLPNTSGTNFSPAPIIETAWALPFAVGPVPLNFTGFMNFIGPKGEGATGDFYHRIEILLHPKLMVDVGTLIGYAPRKIEAGVGFEYWHNKFGNVPEYVKGTEQKSVFFEAGYHF